jgi:hypothetical protein
MTNDEARMTNDELSFVIRASPFGHCRPPGFAFSGLFGHWSLGLGHCFAPFAGLSRIRGS